MTKQLKGFMVILITATLLFYKCSSGSTNENSEETSTEAITDETVSDDVDEEEQQENQAASAAGELTQEDFDSTVAELTGNYQGYDASVSTDIYEASSTIDWLIDENLNVLYYKESYAVESMEGSREYYYENGRMWCYTESESVGDGSETLYFCRDKGGAKITTNDLEGTSSTENYSSDDLNEKEQMIRQSFDEFVNC